MKLMTKFILTVILVGTGFRCIGQSTLTPSSDAKKAKSSEDRDRVIQIIWSQADRSQLYQLAQELLDSIGPRLTGSLQQRRANDWILSWYRKWDIQANAEQYGT